MKILRCMIAAAAFAVTLPAHAGINDPLFLIYRASGVLDLNAGFATAVYCTNFGGATEKLAVVIRGPTGAIVGNVNVNLASFNTAILTTRDVNLYTETTIIGTGEVSAGTVGIAATSSNFTCTVSLIQHFTTGPIIAPLHLMRFSPIAGTQE